MKWNTNMNQDKEEPHQHIQTLIEINMILEGTLSRGDTSTTRENIGSKSLQQLDNKVYSIILLFSLQKIENEVTYPYENALVIYTVLANHRVIMNDGSSINILSRDVMILIKKSLDWDQRVRGTCQLFDLRLISRDPKYSIGL